MPMRHGEGGPLVGGLRWSARHQCQAGHEAADQQSEGGDDASGSTLTPVTQPAPPEAPREPFEHTEHGVARPDPYRWMHGDMPALLEYLSAERASTTRRCAHLHPLISTLAAEMFSRLPPAEVSARWRRTRFSYYTVHPAGNDYAQIFREIRGFETHSKQISPVLGRLADENRIEDVFAELVLDIGALADDSGYLEVGLTIVSPDEDLLAYSVDTTGDEVYTLRFRDLRTGEDLAEVRAAQLLRRRLERRLPVVLLHRPRRAVPPATRCGGTGSGRRPRTTCWCSTSRTSGSASTSAPAGPATSSRSLSESRDTSEVWARRRPCAPSRRRGRSVAAGRGLSTGPNTSAETPAATCS